MLIEFDPAKSERNRSARGLPFELVVDLDWARAVTREDERREYGEVRMVALAPLKGRLHVVCYTKRSDV